MWNTGDGLSKGGLINPVSSYYRNCAVCTACLTLIQFISCARRGHVQTKDDPKRPSAINNRYRIPEAVFLWALQKSHPPVGITSWRTEGAGGFLPSAFRFIWMENVGSIGTEWESSKGNFMNPGVVGWRNVFLGRSVIRMVLFDFQLRKLFIWTILLVQDVYQLCQTQQQTNFRINWLALISYMLFRYGSIKHPFFFSKNNK